MPQSPPHASNNRNKPTGYKHSKDDMIFTNRWNKLRNQYREQHPVCERCQYMNDMTKDSVKNLSVHHIYPRNKFPDMAFNTDNLLTLCSKCHGHYNNLELINLDQAMAEGRQIKANRYIQGNRIALIGNINSGKSAIITGMQQLPQYEHYRVIAIDDYRRKYADPLTGANQVSEQSARHAFIHDIKNTTDCIIVMVGYGRIWEQVRPMVNSVVLVQCDPAICYERFRATQQRVPVPIEWTDKHVCGDSIRAIADYHKSIECHCVIDTSNCNDTSEFIVMGETVNVS